MEYELYHHGIKGMKWGIRRFQKKDGSLTPAGKKRYTDDSSDNGPKKSKHRQNLEAKYRAKGMSQQEAEQAAAKRIKTEKIIAATAAMTVAAATAYVVNKNIKERTDGILKAGTKLQRISADPNESLDRAFYTAYGKSDTTKYKGLYGKQIRAEGKQAHKMMLNVDKDVKIASRRKAEDAFVELYKNDPEFRKGFEATNDVFNRALIFNPKAQQLHNRAAGKMSDRQLRKIGYDAFNRGLVVHTPEANSMASKFYDKLKEQGYDAIMDINDQKYSGFKAKAPVIVFNRGNKISLSDVKQMTDEQIASNAQKAQFLLTAPEVIKSGAAYSGVFLASRWGTKKLNSLAVENYKKEHPGTTMTDKEILKMLRK